MTVRAAAIRIHRWLGLAVAALWLLQAATGILCVFHWEIDDAITPGVHRAIDFRAIEQHVTPLAPHSMWSTAGRADRFDVSIDGAVVRIDGEGNTLRTRRDDETFTHGGIVDTLVVLHQSLLAGDRGRWITGSSGVLLLSNLLLGAIAAWPRRGQWMRALRPVNAAARVARRYSWHRAVGLWIAVPAMCVVAAGVLLAFDEQLEKFLGVEQNAPSAPAGVVRIGLPQAAMIATARFPGCAVSGVSFPTAEKAMWTFTLKQRGEMQRAYGKTRVFIDATNGRVVGEFNALTTSGRQRFLDHLFAFHTGEIVALPGRLIVLATGSGLVIVIYFGVALWWARRPK
jgi:uncharacterized iron-regulated membrane protein